MNALELQKQPDLPDEGWHNISVSLSLPDRAALGRIRHVIGEVGVSILNQEPKTEDATAFSRLCFLACRWLAASEVSVDRFFMVPFTDEDRAALTVCAPHLRRLTARDWAPDDWKKGELADWRVMWALMLDLHDGITEVEQVNGEEDMQRPL